MMTDSLPLLTTRPERGQADLPALVAFYEACAQADPNDHAPTLAQLQHRLDHPPPGGRQHRQYWETKDGQRVGVVTLWISDPRTDIPPDPAPAPSSASSSRSSPELSPASSPDPNPQENPSPPPAAYPPLVISHLTVILHPSYRHQGLEASLIDWAEHYVQTTRPDPDIPVQIRVTVNQEREEEQAIYEAHGFRQT